MEKLPETGIFCLAARSIFVYQMSTNVRLRFITFVRNSQFSHSILAIFSSLNFPPQWYYLVLFALISTYHDHSVGIINNQRNRKNNRIYFRHQNKNEEMYRYIFFFNITQ